MAARPVLVAALIGSLVMAAPAFAALDQSNPAPAATTNAHDKCDANTHLDATGAPCKDKAGDQSGGGKSSTWLAGVLGVAAVVGVVAALSSSKSPASP